MPYPTEHPLTFYARHLRAERRRRFIKIILYVTGAVTYAVAVIISLAYIAALIAQFK